MLDKYVASGGSFPVAKRESTAAPSVFSSTQASMPLRRNLAAREHAEGDSRSAAGAFNIAPPSDLSAVMGASGPVIKTRDAVGLAERECIVTTVSEARMGSGYAHVTASKTHSRSSSTANSPRAGVTLSACGPGSTALATLMASSALANAYRLASGG